MKILEKSYTFFPEHPVIELQYDVTVRTLGNVVVWQHAMLGLKAALPGSTPVKNHSKQMTLLNSGVIVMSIIMIVRPASSLLDSFHDN